MSKDILARAYDAVIEFTREKFPKEIDDAYDFFWEEDDPADLLMGHALELGFINFEDWLVCDYTPADKSMSSFIDRFIESEQPDEDMLTTLQNMKSSFISLYEVVESGSPTRLQDLALQGDPHELAGDKLAELEKGYVFAARLIDTGDKMVLGRCAYPFGASMKDHITGLLDKQFERYHKSKNPEGSMEDFLREETYTFNITWLSSLYRPR